MRYSEFEREVKKLGYEVETTNSFVRLKDSDEVMVAEINKNINIDLILNGIWI